jgi:hypothetical protein
VGSGIVASRFIDISSQASNSCVGDCERLLWLEERFDGFTILPAVTTSSLAF